MKKLYLFILLMVAFGSSQVFSQTKNITVFPSYPPTALCDGDNATLTIFTSVLPTGHTLEYYNFWVDNGLLGGRIIGFNPATHIDPNIYTMTRLPPGIYNGWGEAVSTDSNHYFSDTISFIVYYLPIADFKLRAGVLDTQCLKGNSFCFETLSGKNPLLPSNPIASCLWVFGDGAQANDCNPVVCHAYGLVNQFNPVLKITDDHGCVAAKENPHGHDSLGGSPGVTVVPSATPNFKWDLLSGFCFKRCYRFTNLAPLAISKVNKYQWDFGDKTTCDQWWEPDSTSYTGFIPYYKQPCDPTVGISDSTHYDTITHCYCEAGEFRPKLAITNIWGCTDSLRKTPSNTGGTALPMNINFKFDITTTTEKDGNILADSVCVGSGNASIINFKQTPIFGINPGFNGDGFIWDFGDPKSPPGKNIDFNNWSPSHSYTGMGSFFPSLTVQCNPDTTFYYYTAKVVGPYRRFIDTSYDAQRDLIDPTKIVSTFSTAQSVKFTNKVLIPPLSPSDPAFDGQAMIVDAIDSVQLRLVDSVYNSTTGSYFGKYKMVDKYRYYGDTAYYFNLQPFTSPYIPYPTISPDSIPVYQYWGFAPRNGSPLSNFYVPLPIAQMFETIRDSIIPLSMPTGLKDVNADLCLKRLGLKSNAYYFNTIVDTNGKALPAFWYKYARSYNYGVRVLGPFARIENPPVPVVIKPAQKQQCGPDDTVDFVNTSGSFKSRNIWRRWDFGDIYAPQCTSFSVPKHELIPFSFGGRSDPSVLVEKYPPIVAIDSFAFFRPKHNENDYLQLSDELVILRDTVRKWSDAVEQFMNSDHFFINNGATYPGRRNCNYSHDTLPRHLYPNWDSVYLWYRYGHDFMPWKKDQTPGGYMFSDTVPQNVTNPPSTQNIFANKPWDTTWWGKPVYLNILKGEWSLKQDSSWGTHYVDTTYICNYFLPPNNKQVFYYTNDTTIAKINNCQKKYIIKDSLPGIWVKWPRIDTLNQALPLAQQLPKDLWPGNSADPALKGIDPKTVLIPDPFQMAAGQYTIFGGIVIDTAVHFPPLYYTLANGQRITLPSGTTLLPGSSMDFFEYMFKRVIQKCITVKLRLADTLNNESKQGGTSASSNLSPNYPNDNDTLDAFDCWMEDSKVILALGKPDARGMGWTGHQCPGLRNTQTSGDPSLTFDEKGSPAYPGFKLECGNRTSIWVDMDSTADRMDATPCYLDGFTSWGQGPQYTPQQFVGTPPVPTYNPPTSPYGFSTVGYGQKLTGSSLLTGNLINVTPGGLLRPTFYIFKNWNLNPPNPWGGADGKILIYHMGGGNSGTAQAADTLTGYVTIGVFIGNGMKDTTIDVWQSLYYLNKTNATNPYSPTDNGPLKDNKGSYYNTIVGSPNFGNPWTYADFLPMDSVANHTTPPQLPIPAGWVDDSLGHTYSFYQITNKKPKVRYIDSGQYTSPHAPVNKYDTMYTLQYLDQNWPRCVSDTVWYHNFWRIKELNAQFGKSPVEITQAGVSGNYPASYLREREDTVWVMYADSVQDSIKYDTWMWKDGIVTTDSFYHAGFDTTNNYFIHGIRRVRYNIDVTDPNRTTPLIVDSLVWPCGVYGDRQFKFPIQFYKRTWDSIGFIAPDILMLRNKCIERAHSKPTYIDTLKINIKDTASLSSYIFDHSYYIIGTKITSTDTILLYARWGGLYADSVAFPVQFAIAKADTAKLLPSNFTKYFDTIGYTFSTNDSLMLRGKDSRVILPQVNISTADTAKLDSDYRKCLKPIGFTPPNIIVYQITRLTVNHPVNIHIRAQDTVNLPANFRRFLIPIGASIAPDTLVFRSVCPIPNHDDGLWKAYPQYLNDPQGFLHFGYTNYTDTLFLRMKDTLLYTQFKIIDTAMMQLPIWHVYHKTSWEISLASGTSVTAITSIDHFMENTQSCTYLFQQLFTVGIIDTLHIYGADWVEDTIFCKNEAVHFIDSLRYWRFDNTQTNTANFWYGSSKPSPGYNGYNYGPDPIFGEYQFDTIDFWSRDNLNPSDTLIDATTIYTNSQIDFRYFPGQWTNYDESLTYLGANPKTRLTGHWDAVLRGGNVKVMQPNGATDTVFERMYPGMVIFCPVTTVLGPPGLFAWNQFKYWEPCFAPLITYTGLNSPNYDTLHSITDTARVPIPTVGRTILFNNGKGAYKKVGMFYWNGGQWVFISNNQYTTFPFYTHRVYWNFGDGTPIIASARPTHQFQGFGRFKVTMASRDSIGHFDTCIAFVEVMKPVAKFAPLSRVIGCKDTASFIDSSYVITGPNDTNTIDHQTGRRWWFTIRYSYPTGLHGQDTINANSILVNPVWYYSQKGVFKVKMAIVTEQGCMDTAYDSIIVQGPRPSFKFFTDTIGCKPFRVGIWNMADSFGMRSPSDTPTLTTVFYWGDGQQDRITGRRDTVWHTYTDTGTYHIVALGRDALPFNAISCPETLTPDTVNGFEQPINVHVKQSYYAKINVDKDTVCVNQPFDVFNTSDSLNYLAYRFERRFADSVLTFIKKDSMYGNAPLKNQWFDSVGLYKFILFPTTYQPWVLPAAQCALQDTISVRALKPKANFDTVVPPLPPLFSFKNTSIAADYYQWTIFQKDGVTPRSDGQKTVYPPNIDFQYDLGFDTGTYKVCLVAYTIIPNYPEKCNDTICKIINYAFITKINIPNVFTPNGDGPNDFFKIDILGELKYDLMIYNRWGTKVFTSTDQNYMWNGKDNNTGADCAEGTYFYVFTYRLKGDVEKNVHGTITLLRQ